MSPHNDQLTLGRQPSELYKLFFLKLPEHRKETSGARTLDVQKIADLAAANAAQAQQLKDLQVQPTGAAHRAEHKRP